MHTFESLRAALAVASGRVAHVREILRTTDELFIRPYPSDYHFDTQNQHYIDSMMLVNMPDDIDFMHAQLDCDDRDGRRIDDILRLCVGMDVAEILRELQEIEIRDAMLRTLWNSRRRLADITNRQ